MATKSARAKIWFRESLTSQVPELEDRYGNFKSTNKNIRIKLNKTSWRAEVRKSNHWYKIEGNYYTKSVWKDVLVCVRRLQISG